MRENKHQRREEKGRGEGGQKTKKTEGDRGTSTEKTDNDKTSRENDRAARTLAIFVKVTKC